MNPLVDVIRAVDFAAQRHTDQRRKGERAEPYVNHLAEVAHLVAAATAGNDPVAVIAAVLHDAVEDADTTVEEIAELFGRDVAEVVAECTDDTTLPQTERKRRQVDSAPRCSTRARIVKLADKISNLRALRHSPPRGWPVERRLEYFTWARAVVEGCRGTNAQLEALFDEVYERGMAELAAGPRPSAAP